VCRNPIILAAKNHTLDNIIEVLTANGMSEEQRTQRLDLIQQHTATLEAHPEFRDLTAPGPPRRTAQNVIFRRELSSTPTQLAGQLLKLFKLPA